MNKHEAIEWARGPSLRESAQPVQEPREHLKQYGYAPGSYMGRCHACDKIASGVDKRAITCRPCAEVRHAALAQHGSDYERGFVDGMLEQVRRSVDKAVNAMDEPVRSLRRVGKGDQPLR